MVIIGCLSFFSCKSLSQVITSTEPITPVYSYTVIRKYPHDPTAFTQGEISANIWYSDFIACISLLTDQIERWIDMTALLDDQNNWDKENVINGIKYDKKNKRIFATGKRWPHIYKIAIINK